MTTLLTTQSPNHRATAAEYRSFAYFANGWDRMVRWNGRDTTTALAGISGPSRAVGSWAPSPTVASGNVDPGIHLFRYRYQDPETGYVSMPSVEVEINVASGGKKLTFAVSTTGTANIIRSTDPKATRLILEATVVGAGPEAGQNVFFKIAEAAMSASSIDANLSDVSLEAFVLPWGSPDTHSVPPVTKYVVSHQERLWLFGDVVHAVGTANFTNASADVGEGSTDPDWRVTALGDDTASPPVDPSTDWLIRKAGEARAYAVDYFDEDLNKLVLKEPYQGSTLANAGYELFSRQNNVYVSRAGYPESFDLTKVILAPSHEGAGQITAGLGYGTGMLFFTSFGMLRFTWVTDPTVDALRSALSTERGALNQRVVLQIEGVVYSMDRVGWFLWDGAAPQNIGERIESLRAEIDYAQHEKFFAVYLPEARAVRWFYCRIGDTWPMRYVQFDTGTGSWRTGVYTHALVEGRTIPAQAGMLPFLLDSAGHSWSADQGYADGVPSTLSHASVIAVSTPTYVNVDLPLPTAGVGLTGCYVQRVSTGERKLIASNTSLTLVLASPFATTPAAGEALWIGPYNSRLKTRSFHANDVDRKRRNRRVYLDFVPSSLLRLLQVRAFADLGVDPVSFPSVQLDGAGNQVLPDGAFWPGTLAGYLANAFLVFTNEADGRVRLSPGMDWRRRLEIELYTEEPGFDGFELVGVFVDGSETGVED